MLVLELLEHDRETYTALDYTNRYRAVGLRLTASPRLAFLFGPIFAQFSIVDRGNPGWKRPAPSFLFKTLPPWSKRGTCRVELRDSTPHGIIVSFVARWDGIGNGFVHGLRVFRWKSTVEVDCDLKRRMKVSRRREHSSLADFRRIELLRTDFGNTLRMFGADREGGEVFLRR